MNDLSIYSKRIRLSHLCATMIIILVALLFVPSFSWPFGKEPNRYKVYMYGELVGTVSEPDLVEACIIKARKELVGQGSELYMVEDPEVSFEAEKVFLGNVDKETVFYESVKETLQNHRKTTLSRAYMVKVNGVYVNLRKAEDVDKLLQDTINVYDPEGLYNVIVKQSDVRVMNVLTATASKKKANNDSMIDLSAGIEQTMTDSMDEANEIGAKQFEEYELGVKNIGFSEEVEVVESYVHSSDIVSVEQAKGILTAMQDVEQVYEVKPGDTLSQISIDLNIPMETIVEMNKDYMESVNSVIHVGQGLVITVPEPELSVAWTERLHYDETYEADVIYIDNDEWYTTKSVVKQEPSAGFREVIADVSYLNDVEVNKEIIKEDVVMEAVPKIVERGTKVPPTYIKPISGGRFTSGFGKRTAPKKGASTYHKGIDWATAVGTPVYASSGGTVAKAGWGSGYGNVVYINHPDGRQTRYGHLSKILVSAGQTVKQGDRIALSGNTGVSTGPHVHFEILINGSQVNPLNYIN